MLQNYWAKNPYWPNIVYTLVEKNKKEHMEQKLKRMSNTCCNLPFNVDEVIDCRKRRRPTTVTVNAGAEPSFTGNNL